MVNTRKRAYSDISSVDKMKQMDGVVEEKKRFVYLPDENWLDVFTCIARARVAIAISFVCLQFSHAAEKRLHTKLSDAFPRSKNLRIMRNLRICCKRMKADAKKEHRDQQPCYKAVLRATNGRELKWPEVPLPTNIVGVEKIYVKFLNTNVMEFLDRIKSLLAKNLCIGIGSLQDHPSNNLALERVLPMCSDIIAIGTKKDNFGECFAKFPQLLDRSQLLGIDMISKNLDLAAVARMVKWLAEPKPDGQPKQLLLGTNVFNCLAFINQLKENFRSSTAPSPLLIRMVVVKQQSQLDGIQIFCEQNLGTGEQMQMALIKMGIAGGTKMCINGGNGNYDGGEWLITRCPISDSDPERNDQLKIRKEKLIGWEKRSAESVLHFEVEMVE